MSDDNGPDLTEGADNDLQVRDAERKLQAWELKTEGKSLAFIGEKIGVSKTSAWRWVEEGRKLARALGYLDKTRGTEEGVAVMEMVRSWMFDLRGELDPADQVDAAKVVILAERHRAELCDLLAAKKLSATLRNDDGRGPVVDGDVVRGVHAAAIERYERGEDPHDDGPAGRSW